MATFNVATHLTSQLLCLRNVYLLYRVLLGIINEVLQLIDVFLLRLLNRVVVESFDLSQVSLGYKSGSELIHLCNHHGVQFNIKILGSLNHVIDFLYILSDRFEGVVMGVIRQEGSNFELVFETEVLVLGLLLELDIYINAMTVS
jgi:hypothetical protein